MQWSTRRHQQFADDMQAAGFQVRPYRGRFWYDGPAVETNRDGGPDLQTVIRATEVPVQWDDLGKDLIVYPKEG